MPIYLRIIILAVIYIIYLVTSFLKYRFAIKRSDKSSKKKINSKHTFNIILVNILLVVILFTTLQEYVFLSYLKMTLLIGVMVALIIYNISDCIPIKEGIISLGLTISLLFKVFAVILVFISMFIVGLFSEFLYEYEGPLNPIEKVEVGIEETKFTKPTVNLYDLEYENDVKNSIGFKKYGGTYFFYYKTYKPKRNIEKEISPTEVLSITPIYNENTYIIAEETKYDIIFTERRPESKYYKKEVSETKYRMYINPEEYVQVDE